MINTNAISAQTPAQNLQLPVARPGKERPPTSAPSAEKQVDAPTAGPQLSLSGANAALSQDSPTASNNLTAPLSPISDGAQAAAATQHARLLIQGHARLALIAQANSSSQSVQRLLQ